MEGALRVSLTVGYSGSGSAFDCNLVIQNSLPSCDFSCLIQLVVSQSLVPSISGGAQFSSDYRPFGVCVSRQATDFDWLYNRLKEDVKQFNDKQKVCRAFR